MTAAVRYARQLAAGLAAAHAAGVVHRDLKPANIMIGEDDQALLMDFGIARSSAPGSPQRTVAGAVVGTAAYMAPEQARGETVDHRADIYAFGLILYEMLCGPRFMPKGAVADLFARMTAPPAPARAANGQVPEALDAIVTRCVQPGATGIGTRRAAELAAALPRCHAAATARGRPAHPRSERDGSRGRRGRRIARVGRRRLLGDPRMDVKAMATSGGRARGTRVRPADPSERGSDPSSTRSTPHVHTGV